MHIAQIAGVGVYRGVNKKSYLFVFFQCTVWSDFHPGFWNQILHPRDDPPTTETSKTAHLENVEIGSTVTASSKVTGLCCRLIGHCYVQRNCDPSAQAAASQDGTGHILLYGGVFPVMVQQYAPVPRLWHPSLTRREWVLCHRNRIGNEHEWMAARTIDMRTSNTRLHTCPKCKLRILMTLNVSAKWRHETRSASSPNYKSVGDEPPSPLQCAAARQPMMALLLGAIDAP